MPYPINNANHFNPYINAHPLASQQAPQAVAPRPVMRPGAGMGIVKGQQVSMTPLCRSGFTSAFPTQRTSMMADRGRLAVSSRKTQQILANDAHLSQKAERDMHAISTLDLRSLDATYEVISRLSQHHIQRFSRQDIDTIIEALDDYQGPHGDNLLMNISAMGYPSLEHYLHHTGVSGPQAVEQFIRDFTNRHDDASDLSEDDIDEIRTRLAERLAEPTRILLEFIHSSPRLSDIPLLKGASGGDNPVTTQVNGVNTLLSALDGNAIHFNGFLSTTSNYDVALEFSDIQNHEDLGRPMYTVDLNNNSEESEILRRDALRAVQSNECGTDSILYYFKSSNVAGISVNATKASAYPNVAPDHLATEDEILLNPGHFFQPEQVVLYSEGVAMIGSLQYGKN
ncbi:hypothetical protein SAMN05216596_1011220 [Pseudomonas congelans]|nr:hypothetical protein [Pseudomonas congelans]SDO70529.1 hypothetical protein SAMN05216596_1011220 [Pseudomonas congelans]